VGSRGLGTELSDRWQGFERINSRLLCDGLTEIYWKSLITVRCSLNLPRFRERDFLRPKHREKSRQMADFHGRLKNGRLPNMGYDQDMPYILEHLTSLRQEITDLRTMNERSALKTTDTQIDQSAVEMRANRLAEIKKELSQMLNRPEDPQVWWEKGRRNRVA
jgi:hypothetical protein